MTCPTCDHTMHQWGEAGEVWVCPRCGTVRDSEGVQVPQLVTRVIEFASHLTAAITRPRTSGDRLR